MMSSCTLRSLALAIPLGHEALAEVGVACEFLLAESEEVLETVL
jgi:hypothetical protein